MPRPRPAPVTTCYRAYLRGRLAAAGLLDDREAKLYNNPALPTLLLTAYALGAISNQDPLSSEAEVDARVHSLLAATAPAVPTRAADSMAERAYKLIDPDDLAIEITAEEVVISGRPLPHVQLDPELAFRHVCGSQVAVPVSGEMLQMEVSSSPGYRAPLIRQDAGATDPGPGPDILVGAIPAQVGV